MGATPRWEPAREARGCGCNGGSHTSQQDSRDHWKPTQGSCQPSMGLCQGGDLTLGTTKPWPHIAPRTQRRRWFSPHRGQHEASEEGGLHTVGFEREEGQAQCQQGSLSDTGRLSGEHNVTGTAEKGHLLMLALAAAWNSCKQTYRRVEPVCRDQGTETAVEMSRECLLCRKMSTRCLPTTEKNNPCQQLLLQELGHSRSQESPKPQHYRGEHTPSVCKVSPTGMSFWPQGKGSGRPRNSQRNLPLPN